MADGMACEIFGIKTGFMGNVFRPLSVLFSMSRLRAAAGEYTSGRRLGMYSRSCREDEKSLLVIAIFKMRFADGREQE